jgi:hypothetical protein
VTLNAANVNANESAGKVTFTITRAGDLSTLAQVDFATADGTASERSDYTAAVGTLHFAPGETTQTVDVFITNDVLSEGVETFSIALSNPVNMALGGVSSATVDLSSDDAPTTENPVRWDASFDSAFFVRQHYVDFLNREPDDAGLAYWKNQIDECETRPVAERETCRELRRINVSAAFFLSIEFQQTGYLVYRAHQAAFNTGERLPLRTFFADMRAVGHGVIVGPGAWQAQLENNTAEFFRDFVARSQFTAQYQSMTNAQYVDALNANTAGSLNPAERDGLISGLDNATQTRATVLRAIVENPEFTRRHYNRAFVLMQYFGYLRRNPSDPPEETRDYTGYNYWLSKLDQHGGNFVEAEMVKAFLISSEYQQRFGP